MKIDRRHLCPTLLAALAALLLIAAAGCSGDEEIASTTAGTAELPDQELFDYVLTESEAGVPSWELSSDRLERFLKKADVEDEVELFGVRMRFYRDGEPFSLLTSERGRANLKKKDIFTWGDVVVVTTDGRRLETDQYANQGKPYQTMDSIPGCGQRYPVN